MDSWKDVAGWLWALLLLPFGWAFKRIEGAVQKPDFAKHRELVREDIRQLYANAEADRKLVRDCVDRLSKEMHEMEIRLFRK
jgi:hypothetical protein